MSHWVPASGEGIEKQENIDLTSNSTLLWTNILFSRKHPGVDAKTRNVTPIEKNSMVIVSHGTNIFLILSVIHVRSTHWLDAMQCCLGQLTTSAEHVCHCSLQPSTSACPVSRCSLSLTYSLTLSLSLFLRSRLLFYLFCSFSSRIILNWFAYSFVGSLRDRSITFFFVCAVYFFSTGNLYSALSLTLKHIEASTKRSR